MILYYLFVTDFFYLTICLQKVPKNSFSDYIYCYSMRLRVLWTTDTLKVLEISTFKLYTFIINFLISPKNKCTQLLEQCPTVHIDHSQDNLLLLNYHNLTIHHKLNRLFELMCCQFIFTQSAFRLEHESNSKHEGQDPMGHDWMLKD